MAYPSVDEAADTRGERRISEIRELAPAKPQSAPFADPFEPEAVTTELPVLAPSSRLAPDAAARRLIDALVERGVSTFFGVPGGPVCPVFEAIRLNPRARLIESRHETHAVFAASLYHRASGRVPAIVVTAGPGVTNAVTGIASASLERTPLLVIAGDVAWATTGGRMAQDSGPEGIAIESLLGSITRIQVRAAHARSVVSQALAALDVAVHPANPGPALFVLPLDRAMQSCELQSITPPQPTIVYDPPRSAVQQAAQWLMQAARPLIVIGAGCRGHERALRHEHSVRDDAARQGPRERTPSALAAQRRNGGFDVGAALHRAARRRVPRARHRPRRHVRRTDALRRCGRQAGARGPRRSRVRA
jgi:hypothetical protein